MAEIRMDENTLCYECPECRAEVEPGQGYCPEFGESLEWEDEGRG